MTMARLAGASRAVALGLACPRYRVARAGGRSIFLDDLSFIFVTVQSPFGTIFGWLACGNSSNLGVFNRKL